MSAYLATAYPDRVELLTDGASTLDDGTLAQAMTKVWHTPLVPFAVTGAGDLDTVKNIALYLRGWAVMAGVDGALDMLGAMPRPEGSFSIVIAAISEEHGAGVWVYSSMGDPDGFGKGHIPAYTVTRWEGFIAMGSGLGTEGLAALGLTRADFANGIRDGGLRIMDAWRATACVSPARLDLGAGHYIGAHVDHAIITADGVTVERVHTWSDAVGEKIRPKTMSPA